MEGKAISEKREKLEVLASVIIPCYNAAKTLTRTIESLEEQSCKDFEVFVIDDGSTDETLAVVRRLQKESKINIEVIAQDHAGVSVARNRGLDRASGKYIFFLDADDIYHNRVIEIMTGIGEATGVDLVISHQDRNLERLKKSAVEIGEVRTVGIEHAVEHFMYQKRDIHFGGLLYRRELIDTLRFTEGCAYGEDLEFTWKYMANCGKAVVLENKLYGYDLNSDSVTGTVDWSRTDNVKAMIRTEEYLRDKQSGYLKKYSDYMLPRVAWTTAKNFAVSGRCDLFERFGREYLFREYMRRLIGSAREPMLRLSAMIYSISPRVFYTVIGWYGRHK